MQALLTQVNTQLQNLLQNQWFSAALTLFLVLYGGMASPELPAFVADLFENAVFRLLVLFLIAYTASRNTTVALITSVVFALVMTYLSQMRMAEGFMEAFEH